jgi:hypothetical protein
MKMNDKFHCGNEINNDPSKLCGFEKVANKFKEKLKFNPLDIVGKPVAEANIVCEAGGYTMRVMEEDGEALVGTCDLRSNRINVAVANGNVIRLQGIG